MESFGLYFFQITVLSSLIWNVVDSTCTLPSAMQSKTFEMHYMRSPSASSSRASHGRTMTTYTTSTIDGIAVTVHGESINQWTCLFNDSDNFVLKSSSVIDIGGTDYYVYYGFLFHSCVEYKNDDFCLIKPLCDEYSSASDEQLKVIAVSSGDPTTISEIQGSSVPNAYHFLLPSGGAEETIEDLESLKTAYNLFQETLADNSTGSQSNSYEVCVIVCPILSCCFTIVVSIDIVLRIKIYKQNSLLQEKTLKKNKVQDSVLLYMTENQKTQSELHPTEKVEKQAHITEDQQPHPEWQKTENNLTENQQPDSEDQSVPTS